MTRASPNYSRSLYVAAIFAAIHYVSAWATHTQAGNIAASIHELLVLPLFPLAAYLPMDDPLPFYILMATNSVLWGIAAALVNCVIFTRTRVALFDSIKKFIDRR